MATQFTDAYMRHQDPVCQLRRRYQSVQII